MSPLKIHAGATREEVCDAVVRLYIGRRCALGRTLVMPLRLLWRDYSLAILNDSDLRPMSAKEFRDAIARSPWASVEERGGTGRFRTVVLGVGVRP